MSEFTQELRLLETDEARWKGEVRYLLDALDFRVRVLENSPAWQGYLSALEESVGRRKPHGRDEDAERIGFMFIRAIKDEQERCAKIAEDRIGNGSHLHQDDLCRQIAKAIRRGA